MRVLVIIDDRVLDRRWSPRHTLAFVFGAAAILWGVIITGGFWLASALTHVSGR